MSDFPQATPTELLNGPPKEAPALSDTPFQAGRVLFGPDFDALNVADSRFLATMRKRFKLTELRIEQLDSDFPELQVTIPNSWETVILAPLYDVHLGNSACDLEMFERYLKWIADTPNVISFLGGDIIENASKLSVGTGVYEQDFDPDNQMVQALGRLASIQDKLLFAIPGNHEDRTDQMGVRLTRWMAMLLELAYFPDYCFCTIRWRGNNFRLAAHHGSGAAQSPGGQLNAGRKELAWVNADINWTGHLHKAYVSVDYRADFDQKTNRVFERSVLSMQSPSFLRYFGTYAAKKRLPPGHRGISAAELYPDGTMKVSIHAKGKRL